MDRDFLFGVLAVQTGLASPQQIMAAASAHVADKSRSIPSRLSSDGVLDPQQVEMLSKMVDQAIAVHGGDVKQTMGTLGGKRALFSSFGGSLVEDEDGALSIAPVTDSKDDSSDESSAAVTPEASGRYRLDGEEVGRGGIGRVLVAFDEHMGREVAVKELLADTTGSLSTAPHSEALSKTSALAARFLREARVTGQLEHPNIVPVYEVGQRASGAFYYTMKLVRGRTLADALGACRTLGDRLELLHHYVDLCNAVAYAHDRGVIHRDIKTDNVMLGEFGETVVLDWGLAKVKGKKDIRGRAIERDVQLLHEEGAGKTVDGSAIGTPAYMAPEQADGAIDDIDERSDVWSLGAVLYELLTGKPPFEGITPYEIMGKVLKDEVVPPRTVNDAIPAELSAVAHKALTRDKAGRYQAAGDLASEIGAFMAGGRIKAYDYSAWELVRGFVARHKAVSALVGLIVVLVAVGSAFLFSAYRQANVERDRANEQRERATRGELSAHFNLALGLLDKAHLLLRRGNVLGARIYAAASLLHNPHHPKSPHHDSGAFEHSRAEETFVEAYSVYKQGTLTATVWPGAILRHDERVHAVALSRDGSQLATAGQGGAIRIWDTAAAKPLQSLEGHERAVLALTFSPDGELLASSDEGGTVRLWSARDYEPLGTYSWHSHRVAALAFAPSSKLLASVSWGRRAVLWDLERQELREVAAELNSKSSCAAFTPDGKRFVLPGGRDQHKQLQVWDVAAGKLADAIDIGVFSREVAIAPDGRLLVSVGQGRGVESFDLRASERGPAFLGHTAEVNAVSFVPGRSVFVSGGDDGTLRLWDAESGDLAHVLEGHRARVQDVAVASDGRLIASASWDQTVRLWHVRPSERALRFRSAEAGAATVLFSPDGTQVARMGKSPTIWDLASGKVVFTTSHFAQFGAFSPNGKHLVTAHGYESKVRVWDIASGEHVVMKGGHRGYIAHVAFSPDGRSVASADGGGGVVVCDAATGAERLRVDGRQALAFSPDGKVLATGDAATAIRLWDAQSGKPIRRLEGHTDQVMALNYSHDGRWLVSAGREGQLRLWDQSGSGPSHELLGHDLWINEAVFSADDELLATAADDWTVRLWSVEHKAQVLVVKAPGMVSGAALSPDGKWLAMDWGQVEALLIPADLSVRESDPAELLAQAQQQAGVKLHGFALVPAE